MAEDIGPVLGLIAFIYGCELPPSYQKFSLNNKMEDSIIGVTEMSPIPA